MTHIAAAPGNKYLLLNGEVHISINHDKIKQDAKWDGLKGYISNTTMNAADVIDNNKQLWHIEKAFECLKLIYG